jgi:hypothetical protein
MGARVATLVLKSDGFGERLIELKLGINRLGRGPENDFQIEHPTISASHCEVRLADGSLIVRDCGSTNGTFVAGDMIQEATLSTGQTFSMGDVELLVESTEVNIAIPKFEISRPAPPIVLTDGSLLCPRHSQARVTHQCTSCCEVMCEKCVHRLRRRGGKVLKLCPFCGQKVEPLGGEKPKKRSLFGLLHKTVKLPFLHHTKP